jgi:hypothetical protein
MAITTPKVAVAAAPQKTKPAPVAGKKNKEAKRGAPPSAKTLAEQKAAKALQRT